jgi:hypothetical protein
MSARWHRFDRTLKQIIGTADEPTLTAIITQPEESLEQVRARLGLAAESQ